MLLEESILWAVSDADVASAISFVELSIAHANAARRNGKDNGAEPIGRSGHTTARDPGVEPSSESSPSKPAGTVSPIRGAPKIKEITWFRTNEMGPGGGEGGEGPAAS